MDILTKTKGQFLKFVLVGIISTFVNYTIFYGLYTLFRANYLVASGAGFLTGVLVGYIFNKKWTFSSRSQSKMEIFKYYGVYQVSLIISLVFLFITVEKMGLDVRIANIIAIGIATITNFSGIKIFVFKA